MRSQNTSLFVTLVIFAGFAALVQPAHAQSDQYKKKSKPAAAAPAAGDKGATPAAEPAKAADSSSGDKLDIKDLEQKYWAPKDTDFSVVQNRTYSKNKRLAFSAMTGPLVNDPYNAGFNYEFAANYYFDERYGVEAMYIKNDLSNSKNTKAFLSQLSGGSVAPDYNRDSSFYGLGFNWVPFYAKMSFLNKKIIYFDMQITPLIGMASYRQVTRNGDYGQTAFAYGFDITQYFFFSNNFAVRANIHNHYYDQKVVSYGNTSVPAGTSLRTDTADTTVFLLGITYFFDEDAFSNLGSKFKNMFHKSSP